MFLKINQATSRCAQHFQATRRQQMLCMPTIKLKTRCFSPLKKIIWDNNKLRFHYQVSQLNEMRSMWDK